MADGVIQQTDRNENRRIKERPNEGGGMSSISLNIYNLITIVACLLERSNFNPSGSM